MLPLAAVLAIQLWTCWGKFGRPFLDTRLHYDYDNADFSFRARCGNRNGGLRSQFAVAYNSYVRWGERRGPSWYNTDHPFLVKALFQQFTKAAGTGESASRIFSFALSFAIAAGLYTLLLQTTGSLPAALAGAVTLVSLPLFAVYQTCVKFEADGMLAGVWLFVALAAYLRDRKGSALIAFGILTALAFLVHWTSALFAGVLGLYLLIAWLRGKDPGVKRALAVSVSSGLAGMVVLAAAMSYIQGGARQAWSHLARSFGVRSAAIAPETWLARQWSYLVENFTVPLLPILGALLVILLARSIWARSRQGEPRGLLPVFVVSTLAVGVVWVVLFRQGSFIHKYWQYWLCLPIAAIVAAFVASLRASRPLLASGIALSAVLAGFLLWASRAAYARVFEDQLGTPQDISFLVSLREDTFPRLVFVPVSETPLTAWFTGPLFEYYTDRAIAVAARGEDLQVGDKLLVLRYRQREEVVSSLSRWSGKSLANEKCGARLCAYDVTPVTAGR